MLFAPLVSTVSIRSFRRVGQRVGQGENSPLKNCAAVIKDYGKNTCAEVSQRTDYSVARRITKSRHFSNEISPASIWRHHSMVCASGCCPSTSSDQVDWRMIHSISSGLIATSQQINSKTSITRSAAECKLLTWCRCPFGRWLFLCRRKNFQNRLFKTRFSVGLNRKIFLEGREQAAQARKCKWSVNFLERASKNRVPVAYAVRGFFSKGHRSKRKFLSDQIGRVIDGRKISSPLN